MNYSNLVNQVSVLHETAKALIKQDASIEAFAIFFGMMANVFDNILYSYELHNIRLDEEKELKDKFTVVSQLVRNHCGEKARYLEAIE